MFPRVLTESFFISLLSSWSASFLRYLHKSYYWESPPYRKSELIPSITTRILEIFHQPSSTNMTPPIGGRPRVYNPQEREVIDKFKARYMMTTSPAERKNLAQGEIFPAVFDHWSKTGVDLTPEETNIRSEVSNTIKL